MIEYLTKINEWLDLIFQYGPFWVYLILFLACFIENVFPPFPGDTFIVAAGALVALDRLDFIPALLSMIVGGFLSVYLIYWFGKNKGRDFFYKKNYSVFNREDMEKSEFYLNKYGSLIVLFSRFVVGFRSSLTLFIGISRFNTVKMIIFSLISYFLFAGLLMYAGIKTVENLDRLEYYFKTYNIIVYPLLIIALVLIILYKVRQRRKKS